MTIKTLLNSIQTIQFHAVAKGKLYKISNFLNFPDF